MGEFDMALFTALATDKMREARWDRKVRDEDLVMDLAMMAETLAHDDDDDQDEDDDDE